MRQDDEELCRRLKAGDPEAFKGLVRDYERPLYAYLCSLLRDPAAAEDAFSEVLMKVWKALPSYRDEGRLQAWLFTIAHRVCLDRFELAKRREESLDSEQGAALRESLASAERGPEREAADGEIRSRLEAAIAGLPEEQRQVLLLKEYGGLTFAEIAGLLGCPLSTALSRMRYAALKLRGSLEGLDA